jgi:hypothetical protein
MAFSDRSLTWCSTTRASTSFTNTPEVELAIRQFGQRARRVQQSQPLAARRLDRGARAAASRVERSSVPRGVPLPRRARARVRADRAAPTHLAPQGDGGTLHKRARSLARSLDRPARFRSCKPASRSRRSRATCRWRSIIRVCLEAAARKLAFRSDSLERNVPRAARATHNLPNDHVTLNCRAIRSMVLHLSRGSPQSRRSAPPGAADDGDVENFETSQIFDAAWCWCLTPSSQQPETIAAILLTIVAKRLVWNNYCAMTHSRARALAEAQ